MMMLACSSAHSITMVRGTSRGQYAQNQAPLLAQLVASLRGAHGHPDSGPELGWPLHGNNETAASVVAVFEMQVHQQRGSERDRGSRLAVSR